LYLCCFFFFSSRRRHTRFSRDWSSDVCSSDLRQRANGEPLDLFNFQEVQFNRRITPKEVDHDADLRLVGIDSRDRADEVVEGAIDDPYLLAHLEGDLHLRRFLRHAVHDLLDFFRAQRRWLVAHANEAGDARRIANHVPRVFVHLHLDQNIAGEDATLDGTAFAILDFNLFFSGHNDVKNFVAHAHGFNALLDGMAHFVLVP